MSDDLALAVRAARLAGAVALERFGGPLDVRAKDDRSRLVSDADHAAEEAVVALLERERPDDGVLGEEGAGRDAARRWIVDPIDGTGNFVAGVAHWCAAIALEDAEGTAVAAVHDPLRDETFTARRGAGARLGDRRLAVAPVAPEDALVHTYLDTAHALRPGVFGDVARLATGVASLRMAGSGSLAMAWVAAGRLGASVLPHPEPWDRLPGALLVTEAGGVSTDVDGALRWHVAGSRELVARAGELLAG